MGRRGRGDGVDGSKKESNEVTTRPVDYLKSVMKDGSEEGGGWRGWRGGEGGGTDESSVAQEMRGGMRSACDDDMDDGDEKEEHSNSSAHTTR